MDRSEKIVSRRVFERMFFRLRVLRQSQRSGPTLGRVVRFVPLRGLFSALESSATAPAFISKHTLGFSQSRCSVDISVQRVLTLGPPSIMKFLCVFLVCVFNLSLALDARGQSASSARRKVIIDQDAFGPAGSNLQAILLAIQSPDVEVLGITITSGDGWCEENTAHTLRMLEIIGRPDIPVSRRSSVLLIMTRVWSRQCSKANRRSKK